VVFSGDMDRAQAAFNIASGAASLGMRPTLFFTFWGLSIITRHDARGGASTLHRALGLLHKPGTGSRPLSRFHLGGVGPALFHRLMRRSGIPDLESQFTMAHSLGVKLVACTTTMGLLGIDKEDIRSEVGEFAGVVTYLSAARAAGVSLFV
jgi:peroxiredoxin family protein